MNMKVWTDRDGKRIDSTEFLKRFKEGVVKTSPLQQLRLQMWSSTPIFAGVLWGLVITFMAKTYWLTLILIGVLPIQSITFLGMYQKYISLKKTEDLIKEANSIELNGGGN